MLQDENKQHLCRNTEGTIVNKKTYSLLETRLLGRGAQNVNRQKQHFLLKLARQRSTTGSTPPRHTYTWSSVGIWVLYSSLDKTMNVS